MANRIFQVCDLVLFAMLGISLLPHSGSPEVIETIRETIGFLLISCLAAHLVFFLYVNAYWRIYHFLVRHNVKKPEPVLVHFLTIFSFVIVIFFIKVAEKSAHKK